MCFLTKTSGWFGKVKRWSSFVVLAGELELTKEVLGQKARVELVRHADGGQTENGLLVEI